MRRWAIEALAQLYVWALMFGPFVVAGVAYSYFERRNLRSRQRTAETLERVTDMDERSALLERQFSDEKRTERRGCIVALIVLVACLVGTWFWQANVFAIMGRARRILDRPMEYGD